MEIPTLINDKKKYYGTYAVMALMNAQTVLDHIQKLAGIEEPKDSVGEENLWEHPVLGCLRPNADVRPETAMFVMEKLQEYFPFLKIMGENQRDHQNRKNNLNRLEVNGSDLGHILNITFRVLKKYRDMSTHSIVSDTSFDDGSDFLRRSEQPLANIVNYYYTVALRNMKDKYDYDVADLAFIQNKRNRIVKGPDGRKKTEADVNFFLSMVAYNGDTSHRLHLSGVGIALLICLFLDKQYINLFLSKLSFISKYNPQSEERRIIIRSMGVNSIRLPKDRIGTEKDSMSVAMDMLNEVKRCPSELFETLSMGDKSRFRIISADYDETLQRRSSDRFAQLLLQYIDYGRLFKEIRFHVNMGKLRYLFNAEKKCIDSETRVRVLEHPLNGFGRIGEVEAVRKQEDLTFAGTGIRIRDFENMKRDDANPENYPYVVDTQTHYMLENNKVEMAFCNDMMLPKIENENGKWHVAKHMPSCRMSTLELPAMAFHILLFGAERTEARIMEVYDNYVRLFDAMSRGEVTRKNIADFGIAECDIPQKVLDCLDGCAKGKDVRLFIETAVNELRTDTDKRLERLKADRTAIGTRDNKMGKRGFRKISTGVIADFLARDIVRFQPDNNDGKDKLTGLNYRVMQASIATYDSMDNQETRKKFKQMFEEAKLLGTNPNRNHPFLHKVFSRTIPENAIVFYERYLTERKSYLESLYLKICKGKNIDVPFVNKNRNRWKAPVLETLGGTYGKNLAVELPRRMFETDIKQELRKMPQMADIDFDSANVTYLIGEYQKRVLGDDSQAFYSWNRNYDYMDMLNGKFDSRGALSHECITLEERENLWENREELTEAYRRHVMGRKGNPRSNGMSEEEMQAILDRRIANARNHYQKSEKAIRRYKVQDTLMFMLVKRVLTATADFDGEKFRLREIMPDADKGILSEMMPMIFSFTKGGKKYNIKADNIKLKNYGDFFALANDKRLPALMNIVGSDVVSKEHLETEFRNYNTCRPEVVSLIFDVEKWAFDTYPELRERVESHEKVGFKAIIDILYKNNNIDSKQQEILRQIRNAFDHNNYPEPGIVEITTLPQIARHMAELFGKYAVLRKNEQQRDVAPKK